MAEASPLSDPEVGGCVFTPHTDLLDADIIELARQVAPDQFMALGEKLDFSLVELKTMEHRFRDDIYQASIDMLMKWKVKQSVGFATKEVVQRFMEMTISKEPNPNSEDDLTKRISHNLTQEECRTHMKDHYKLTGKIQLKPWDKTNYTEFKDLHARISLHVRDRGRRGGFETKKVPLPGSINDVFKRKVNGSLPPRILMLGAAGYGKTTAIAKMAYDWADGDEASPLKDVPFLFALKFRHTTKGMSLGKAILTQLLSHVKGLTPNEIEAFISDNEDDCVVLLDGYDESSGIISSSQGSESSLDQLLLFKSFKRCRVVVTSRPHREEDFDTEDLAKVYAKVEIEGFADDDSRQYINNFFRASPSESRDLIDFLSAQYIIGSLLRVPLFCMAFCTLWQGGFLTNVQTLTTLFDRLLKFLIHHARSKVALGGKSMAEESSPEQTKSLVTALGRVALKGLLGDSKKLIFDVGDFEQCPEQLEIAVILGLVSKQRCDVDSSEWYETSQTSVEFYHALAQEHCAGIYLASLNRKELKATLKKFDPRKVVDLEHVLRFAAGSSPDACRSIFTRLCSFSWKDHRILLDVLSESQPDEKDLSKVLRPHFQEGRLCITRATGNTIYGLRRLPQEIRSMVSSTKLLHSNLSNHQTSDLWAFLAACSSLDNLELNFSRLPHQDRQLPPLPSVHSLHIEGIGGCDVLACTPNVRDLRLALYCYDVLISEMMAIVNRSVQAMAPGLMRAFDLTLFHTDQTDALILCEEVVSDFIDSTLPHLTSLQKLRFCVNLGASDTARVIAACMAMPKVRKIWVRRRPAMNNQYPFGDLDSICEDAREVNELNLQQGTLDYDEDHHDELFRVYAMLFDEFASYDNVKVYNLAHPCGIDMDEPDEREQQGSDTHGNMCLVT